MQDVTITLTDGTEVSGTIAPTGEVWSPLGRELTSDMVASTRTADLDGYDNQLSGDYGAWSARVQRMGRKLQREADRPRSTTRQLAFGSRWSS